MFRRLGTLAARMPLPLIGVWLILVVAVLALAPKLSDVVNSSQASYLPKYANSQQAQTMLEQAFPNSYAKSTAVVVITGPKSARGQAVIDYSNFAVHRLAPAPFTAASDSLTPQLAGALDSRDGQATLIDLGWRQQDSSSAPADSLQHLRAYIAAHPYPNVTAQVTGDVAINADYQTQINKSTAVTSIATVILVLLILLAVFRSVALLIVPAATIGVAIVISNGVVAFLGKHWLTVSSNTPIFLIVLLAGAGTDYCLFLASRYKEELVAGRSPAEAIEETMAHVGEAIASSAAAVIVGLGGMAFANFGLFNTTGPAVAVGVAITLIAALTMTPAILRLLGARAFWPARAEAARPSTFWRAVGGAVTARPLAAIVAVVVVLLPLNLAVLKTGQNFNFLGDLNKSVEAHGGFNTVEAHYGAGNALPGSLVLRAGQTLRTAGGLRQLDTLDAELQKLPGISAVQGPTRPAGRPIAYGLFATNSQVRSALSRYLSASGTVAQYTLITSADPYGAQAQGAMRAARVLAERAFPQAEVHTGGASVNVTDIHDVINSDLIRIALFVLGGIFIVLALLVRAIVAPIYLLITVMLSLGATVGATTLVFQGAEGQNGLVFWVPFLILTMLIGLATDYNILLISRVREEIARDGDYRASVTRAVERTGGIITTCGLVLAGSFGTLMLGSVTGLRELGFAVAFGVIFDTAILRTVLVPALVVLVGEWSWFPRRAIRRLAPVASKASAA
ncbi:MAG TPA: MMPL family transporter [Chloroflexota bacterium]|nr:MMPL family transporter [Chloroflexota bacterium]